ncbi:hypothetical protein IKG73_00145 [Candidatus Saccharibacteria bacterium]|nr:hypothetical protein [Candidatus Saccharibacteria bacterium]
MAESEMNNTKAWAIISAVAATLAVMVAGTMFFLGLTVGQNGTTREILAELPEPELSDGQRGELGIDKNINESTIDKYLNRSDAVYWDLRMLEDPGNYESIGGDRYLSGIVKGFQVVPYPYIATVSGLPSSVGAGYTGPTLFSLQEDGSYKANYQESLRIIEDLFPKDKVIFLMCGGGGYSGMMKKLLVSLGWDEKKIYDVGGYWFYEGENKIEIKETAADGKTYYAFWKIPYHEIDFKKLTPKTVGEAQVVDLSVADYNKMLSDKKSGLIFVDQGGCVTAERMRGFIDEISAENNGAKFYKMMWSEAKEVMPHEKVPYYPSLVIIKDGEIIASLKADSFEDGPIYNDKKLLENWILKYTVL